MKLIFYWLLLSVVVVTYTQAYQGVGRRDTTTTTLSSLSKSTKASTSTTKSTSLKTTTSKAKTTTIKSSSSTTAVTSTTTALNDQCIYPVDGTKNTWYYGQYGQTCTYYGCLGNCGSFNEYQKCDTCANKCRKTANTTQNETCWPKYTACMDTCSPNCGGEANDLGMCGACVDKCTAEIDKCQTTAGLTACTCLSKCASSNCKKCKTTNSLTATSTKTA